MSAASSSQVLSLYRSLLREGRKFNNYNYREYTIRRVRDYFKEKKSLSDPDTISKEYQYGLDSLALIQRQVSLGQMYTQPKLVVES